MEIETHSKRLKIVVRRYKMDWTLEGYKTYICAIATLAYAVGGIVIGKVDPNIAIPLILGALGLGSLRHAV